MIYLRDFEFHDSCYEHLILSLEHRTCFRDIYPFDVFPAVGLTKLAFEPVTLLYGGNGSGKSTALNIIASKLGLQRYVPFVATHFFAQYVNGAEGFDEHGRWVKVPGVSFHADMIPPGSRILCSEDVFERTLRIWERNDEMNRRRDELRREWRQAKNVDNRRESVDGNCSEEWCRIHELQKKSFSAIVRDEVGYNRRIGSNGENAFDFFMGELEKNALYLLDEPENSMSAKWLVKLVAYIEGLARFEGCQFVIATHSPFILGIKGARIYDLDTFGVPVRKWTELENVREYFQLFYGRRSEFEMPANEI